MLAVLYLLKNVTFSQVKVVCSLHQKIVKAGRHTVYSVCDIYGRKLFAELVILLNEGLLEGMEEIPEKKLYYIPSRSPRSFIFQASSYVEVAVDSYYT